LTSAEVLSLGIGPDSQPGQKVQLNYINPEGEHRSAFVDANTVQWRGNRVKVDLWGNGGTMNLVYERIKNPEVLGLSSANPVTEPEPLPPLEEEGPPILHPEKPVMGNPSGPELLYVRRDGSRGIIHFEPTTIEIIGNRVNLNPKGIDKRYAIALHQIINPEILEGWDDEGEEPPILHPEEFIIGDPSGPELLYVRRDGSRGVIYFEPTSTKIIGNRVNLNPKGIDERYAIALDQIINPEILTPEKEPKPEVIHAPPEPEPITSTYEEGTRIILDKIPLDSFEAVQVMRRIKPELDSFKIFDAFAYEPETLLQGYTENQAGDIQEDLQHAGCVVSLQTIGRSGTVIAKPTPQSEILEKPDPPITQLIPQTGRPPTTDEFFNIRFATETDFDEIKELIESAPIEVNARDSYGIPLVFAVQSARVLGLLMDRGADIHAKGDFDNSVLHEVGVPDEVYHMLLQFGADLNARNQVGFTPLIAQAAAGKYEKCKTLIEHGADIHAKSEYGETALRAAEKLLLGFTMRAAENRQWDGNEDHVREGCEKIAALLRAHGAT
tara:strand:- start:514 stop:2172 length:1659 start_codon:yes stop_codon:yes gene_type:complete